MKFNIRLGKQWKHMNVLFVTSLCDIRSPRKPLYGPESIQFGISYISSYLKEHGHKTRLIVLSRMSGRSNDTFIKEALRDLHPGVVLFTAVSTEYPFIAAKARYIRQHYPGVLLVVGGPHASLDPEGVIQDDFDAVCVGEGELPVLELVTRLGRGDVPRGIENFWLKTREGIERNPVRPFLEDLDMLPFPDRAMWDDWMEDPSRGRHSVLLGRGCPFQCTYCCNHALKNLASGPYVRFRSAENILAEINEMERKYPRSRDIFLEVETVGARMDFALGLCDKLEQLVRTRSSPLTFGVNLRVTPNVDYERLFDAFRRGNIRYITVGLESGSERIRRDVLKRFYANDDILHAVKMARKYGIKVGFQNMLGLPSETLRDFRETIKMNRACRPAYVFISIFYPYPGTDLFLLCRERGLLRGELDTRMERSKAVLDLPGFSKREIQREWIWFEYNVYRGSRPLWKLLSRVLVSWLKTNYFVLRVYRRITCTPGFKQLMRLSERTLWRNEGAGP